MKLTLNTLKCGLFSQNPDLVINCARALSKIAQTINYEGGQLMGLAWDWFVDASHTTMANNLYSNLLNETDYSGGTKSAKFLSENLDNPNAVTITTPVNEPGLMACLYALKRHYNEVIEHIAPVFVHFGKNNYMELFTYYLKNKFLTETK